jgi:hypothetical protein
MTNYISTVRAIQARVLSGGAEYNEIDRLATTGSRTTGNEGSTFQLHRLVRDSGAPLAKSELRSLTVPRFEHRRLGLNLDLLSRNRFITMG